MATPRSDDPIALDRPLPGDVLRRVRTGLSAFQNYPVFSARWLRGRTVRVALIAGAVGSLIWLGSLLSGHTIAIAIAGYFTLGVTAMASVGPALATCIRHRRWPRRVEQPLVIGALIACVIAAAIID